MIQNELTMYKQMQLEPTFTYKDTPRAFALNWFNLACWNEIHDFEHNDWRTQEKKLKSKRVCQEAVEEVLFH